MVLVPSKPLTVIVIVPSVKQEELELENARTVTVAPLLIVPPVAVNVATEVAAP